MAAAAMGKLALVLQRAQHAFQLRLADAVEAKGAHDVALGDAAAAFLDECNKFVATRGRGFLGFFGWFRHKLFRWLVGKHLFGGFQMGAVERGFS
jgi:hypothetical protein